MNIALCRYTTDLWYDAAVSQVELVHHWLDLYNTCKKSKYASEGVCVCVCACVRVCVCVMDKPLLSYEALPAVASLGRPRPQPRSLHLEQAAPYSV